VWDKYVQRTPQRVKLLDSFMVFLVVVGALQFVYCVIVGNYVSAGSYISNNWIGKR
jgi:oligosaccharyltransferase complex subunit epsilon